MILVMSGTEDGKEIVKRLHKRGVELMTSVATEYGRSIFEGIGLGNICIQGRLDKVNLGALIDDKHIDTVIDATHPYAVNASLNAIEVCKEKKIRYIRYQRNETPIPESPLIHRVPYINNAVDKCKELGTRIMLTTGFNNLKDFARLIGEKELIVRVLPIADHIRSCIEIGISASNIIALQGPFSKELNSSLFKHFKIDTIVTKESGIEGGVKEKIQAAIEANINVILIERPQLKYPSVYSSINMIIEALEGSVALRRDEWKDGVM